MVNYKINRASPILLALGKIFEFSLMRPLNIVVAYFEIIFLIPILRKILQVKAIFPRRSVLDTKDFNIFFSDLDLGIIIFPDQDLCVLRERFKKLKKVFIFLGELEIYTEEEHILLQKTLEAQSEIYIFFRDIRKVGWLEQELVNPYTKYHQFKSKRGIKKCLLRLGLNKEVGDKNNLQAIEELIEKKLIAKQLVLSSDEKASLAEVKEQLLCPYFGKVFQFPKTSQEQFFPYMTAEMAILLMALTPPRLRQGSQNVEDKIAKLREKKQIYKIYKDLTVIEFTIFKAVVRSFDHLEIWQKNLLNSLEEAYMELK